MLKKKHRQKKQQKSNGLILLNQTGLIHSIRFFYIRIMKVFHARFILLLIFAGILNSCQPDKGTEEQYLEPVYISDSTDVNGDKMAELNY